MSFEEGEISLKNAVKFIVDNRGKTAPTVESGIALIATNCVNNKDLYPQKLNLRYVSHETYETWFRAHPAPGDILLTNKGSQNGAICLVPDPVDFCIAQDMVALRADTKKIYPLFLFAALRSELVQQRIKALNVDAVIPHLKKTDFDKLLIPLPNEAAQRWVGDWYFEMCSRIEVLRETNAALEAIAQALFKSWFVDFDPVRAKMAGRAPEGMDEATAALFPDALEETELGAVPKGWRFGTVGDFAQLKKGTVNPGSQPDAMFEHFSLPAFDNGCRPVVEQGEAIKSNKTPVPSDAVLLSKLNPHIPRVWLPLACGSNAVCSTEFLVFQPVGVGSRELIYCTFSSPDFSSRLQQLVTGTSNSHQRIKPDQVALMSGVIPSGAVAKQFEALTQPVFERVHANREQAQTLASLRDALLPRLISGQLRLPEAQAQLETAA